MPKLKRNEPRDVAQADYMARLRLYLAEEASE